MSPYNKTIWLINQYASTPETGYGGRSYCLASELTKLGYKVYLIAASYTHLLRTPPRVCDEFTFQQISGFHFVWVKLQPYGEAHSKKRIFNWLRFAWQLRKLPGLIPDKPDAILYSSPALVGYIGALQLAKHFQVPLTFEVRDIWPLTLTEIGGHSPSHPFVRILQWIEDKAYRESDHVISNLRNAVEHMVSRGMRRDKFRWIPNGFLLDEVANSHPLSGSILAQIPKGKFIVGYTGTIGVANEMDTLIEAAEHLSEHPEIAFVLVGNGKERERLEYSAKNKSLSNVHFLDAIPKKQVPSMLSLFDVCYIGWLKDDIYRYGIGANKIPEYLVSGKPIIHSYSGEEDPIEESGSGITVPAQDVGSLVQAILKMCRTSTIQRNRIGERGKAVALNQYDYGILAKNLVEIVFSPNKKPGLGEKKLPSSKTETQKQRPVDSRSGVA